MSGSASALETPSRHRVLIVDDEESTRLLLARMLTAELDVEVQLAGTAEQALRLARSYAYDAILLDLLMPGTGGLQVLDEIRSATPNVSTPVIIVSVLSDPDTKNRCLGGGANAYLVKPVDRESLARTVREQLEARSLKTPRRP
jgi:CheY-like chemotaxis protein